MLAKLRAQGSLREIRFHDLRLDSDEVAALLNDQMGIDIDRSDVARLTERTEGWAAGVQLVALSLHHRPDRAQFISQFAGDDRHVSDYLRDEVLARLPERLDEFLVATAILDRFDAALCQAVASTTPRTGSTNSTGAICSLSRSTIDANGFATTICSPTGSAYKAAMTLARVTAAPPTGSPTTTCPATPSATTLQPANPTAAPSSSTASDGSWSGKDGRRPCGNGRSSSLVMCSDDTRASPSQLPGTRTMPVAGTTSMTWSKRSATPKPIPRATLTDRSWKRSCPCSKRDG
jgi:hypothetical protein